MHAINWKPTQQYWRSVPMTSAESCTFAVLAGADSRRLVQSVINPSQIEENGWAARPPHLSTPKTVQESSPSIASVLEAQRADRSSLGAVFRTS